MPKENQKFDRREFINQIFHPFKNCRELISARKETIAVKEKKGLKRGDRGKILKKLNEEIIARKKILAIQSGISSLIIAILYESYDYLKKSNEIESVPENIFIEPFEYLFSNEFDGKERLKLIEVIRKATPELIKFIPIDEGLGKTINIRRSGFAKKSFSNYEKSKLYIGKDSSDGLIIHELVHLLHGKNDTWVNFVEEGIATALSILATEAIGLKSWDQVREMKINETMRDGGLSVLSYIQYSDYPSLLGIRLYFSADLWLELEKNRPGFIKNFHQSYYKFLNEGGSKEELFGEKIIKIIKEIHPEFDQIAIQNPLMRFPEKSKNRQLIYLHYTHFKNGDRSLGINLVQKNGENGSEKGISNQTIFFKIHNLDKNTSSQLLKVYANPDGSANVTLREGKKGEDFLYNQAGYSQKYKITVEAIGQNAELEFEYENN